MPIHSEILLDPINCWASNLKGNEGRQNDAEIDYKQKPIESIELPKAPTTKIKKYSRKHVVWNPKFFPCIPNTGIRISIKTFKPMVQRGLNLKDDKEMLFRSIVGHFSF